MGILDNIKNAANEWTKGSGEEESPKFVKGVINNAVSGFFKISKKTLSFIVKHYEPSFSLDFITNESAILSIYESMKNRPDAFDELRRLVTNNLNTVHLSGEISESIRKYLAQPIKSTDEDGGLPEAAPSYKMFKNNLADFNNANSEYSIILKAVNCIKDQSGAGGKEFLNAIDRLDIINPNWNHPLLSQYVIKAKKGNCSKEELKKYCKKALYSNPVHKEILELAEGLEDSKNKIVYQQVHSLLINEK